MKKRFAAAVLAVLMTASLTACGGKSAGSGEAAAGTGEGGTFIYGLSTEINNFDPFTSTTADAKSIYYNIYEGLVKVNEDGTEFLPAVASEVTRDSDSAYTFTLRDGVKFHNGQDVTMEDVTYSIDLAIKSKINGFDNIRDYSVDGNKITINLNTPDIGFLAYMVQAIVPAGSDDNGELALQPVGTGPYAFSDYEVQDHVTLVKNNDYWGEPAHLDEVEVRFLADQTELLTAFQAGSIDGFSAYGGIVSQLEEGTYNPYYSNSNAVQVLALNNAVKPFDDVRVRQAVAYAVDADEINELVNYGHAVIVGTPVIPGLAKYCNTETADDYAVDTAKAKTLLEEAGYKDGFSFTVKVPSVYPVHVDSAQVMVNQLAKAGITMNIEQVDWATWLDSVYTNRDYEATIISLDAATAYPAAYMSRYQSDAGNNFINYKSDAFDAKYKEAITSTDEDAQTGLFMEAQQILSDECCSVFIEDISTVRVWAPAFEGCADSPLYAIDFASVSKVQ